MVNNFYIELVAISEVRDFSITNPNNYTFFPISYYFWTREDTFRQTEMFVKNIKYFSKMTRIVVKGRYHMFAKCVAILSV